MDDLISRQAAIAAIQNLYPDMPRINGFDNLDKWREKNKQYIECEETINKLPSIQPERAKGKWRDLGGDTFECLVCHEIYIYAHNYCPNCGTEMEGIIRWTF